MAPPHNSVLQEAYNLVTGARADKHGDFKDNLTRAAGIFKAWTGKELTADEISKVMQCIKMAREISAPNERDNFVDQAGYVELRYMLKNNIKVKTTEDIIKEGIY